MRTIPAASSGRVCSRQPLAVCCKTTGTPSAVHSTTSSPVLGLLPGSRLTATERGAWETSACLSASTLRLLSHARVAAPAARLICPTTAATMGSRGPQTAACCGACLRQSVNCASCRRCCSYVASSGAHRRGFETCFKLTETSFICAVLPVSRSSSSLAQARALPVITQPRSHCHRWTRADAACWRRGLVTGDPPRSSAPSA